MSIPYLVHKKDADLYDKIEKARRKLWMECCEFMEKALAGLEGREYCEKEVELRKPYDERWAAIEKDLGGPVPTISMFDPQPADLENYFTYFIGHRWGEAKGDEMCKIAQNGIKACKTALKIT